MYKKWCLMIGVLAVCAATLFYVGTRDKIIPVSTVTLTSQSVDKTVSCDGVIEAGESEAVFAETACFIDKVIAQKGKYVEKGEVLALVDKEATKANGQVSQYDALTLSTMSEEIRAPHSGVILKVEISDGEWVDKSAPCAIIAPSDSIRVRVAIREKHLPMLRSGLSASVSGDGLQNDSYHGVLTEISSTAQSLENGGTIVEGVIEFEDVEEDPSLRIGINVKANIVVETVADGIVIPYEAVGKSSDSRSFVYVLSDGSVEKHAIISKDEISDGLLVADSALVGKTIVMHPEDITAHKRVRYTAMEENE